VGAAHDILPLAARQPLAVRTGRAGQRVAREQHACARLAVEVAEDHRLTIHTDDGAHIYVQYFGVIEYTEAALAANRGERSSGYAEHYFRTAPRLETGDERYAWVNRTVFVGEGRLHPGPVVEYRVHRLT
jgi:hypothetical protein